MDDLAHLQSTARRGASGVTGLLGRLRSGDTFVFLFVLLIIALGTAIIGTSTTAGRVAVEVLSGATLLVTVLAARISKGWMIAGWLVFFLALFVAGAGAVLGDHPLTLTTVAVSHVALLWLCAVLVLRRLLRHETVTVETIAGSLCVYLLIGLAFANLYVAMSAVAGGPVLTSTVQDTQPFVTGDYVYYSFISMLTVGFGDVLPVSQWAKSVTVVQAVIGQVVLLTLVARLVSVAEFRNVTRATAAEEEDAVQDP